MTSVVTNMVVALKIATTSVSQCPCPEGLEGCLVLHTRSDTSVRLEEAHVTTNAPHVAIFRSAMGKSLYHLNLFNFDAARGGKCPILAVTRMPNGMTRTHGVVGMIDVDALRTACGANTATAKEKK